jgi:hypothetical protein
MGKEAKGGVTMPKVALGEYQKLAERNKKLDHEFVCNFRDRMYRQNVKCVTDAADKLQMSGTTLYSRIKTPEKMTLREFREICRKMNFTDEMILNCVR